MTSLASTSTTSLLDKHAFIAAKAGDSRAPCPALNSLANHGYLPRDGKNISFLALVRAMHDVYHLSYPLCILLALGGVLLCGKNFRLSLSNLAAHNKIEHDASLGHEDAAPGAHCAPIPPSPARIRTLLSYASHFDREHGRGLVLADFARARADREEALAKGPLDTFHAQIAQGECALTWLVLKDHKDEVPQDSLWQWYAEERLPAGWAKPAGSVGLFKTRSIAGQVAAQIKSFEQAMSSSHHFATSGSQHASLEKQHQQQPQHEATPAPVASPV